MSIVKPSTAFKAGADWVSAEVRAYMNDQVAIHVDTVTDLRDSDMEKARFVYIKSKAALYRLNLSSGAADDGDTAIHDNLSRRYLKITGTGPGGAFWDVAVDALADRDAYDDEAADYAVFVADTGSGRAALYVKNSATSADWSDPFYFTGLEMAPALAPVVNATDSGAGSANAIQVVADGPVAADGGQLVAFQVFEANTSTTVTLQITDSTAAVITGLAVKTASGNDPAIGALSAGLAVLGQIDGSTFRIISPLDTAATLAAIEAIADDFGDLEAARDEWEQAVTDSNAARATAQEWAESPENTEVETGQYSALHHSAKASAQRVLAEAARDAAFGNANVYDDTAAGLTDTSEGDQFMVVDGDEIIRYSHDAGPAATEVARYPTSDYVLDRLDKGLSSLSGYEFGLVDGDGRLALGVKTDGAIEMPATPKFNALEERPASLSGIEWGVVDQDGRLAFGVNSAGNAVAKGVELDLSSLGAAISDLNSQLYPSSTVDCWGDSLTHGNTTGVTTPYPTALAALLADRAVNNKGLTGRTSLQTVTVFGATPSILTVTDNTIPASGAVSVTATENGNFGSKSNVGTKNYLGSLFGIPGTLAVAFNASDGNLAGASTFTRTDAGAATVIPDRTPFMPDTGGWEGNIPVIWVGRNDVLSAYTDPSGFSNDVIMANIEAMVEFLSPLRKRFVVLAVTDQASEYAAAGGAAATAFAQILDLNYRLAVRYPRNFIDIRKILVNSYDSGEPADVTAFGRNQVPPSLQQDGLHLNDAGYAIVAQAVADFINAKGW